MGRIQVLFAQKRITAIRGYYNFTGQKAGYFQGAFLAVARKGLEVESPENPLDEAGRSQSDFEGPAKGKGRLNRTKGERSPRLAGRTDELF